MYLPTVVMQSDLVKGIWVPPQKKWVFSKYELQCREARRCPCMGLHPLFIVIKAHQGLLCWLQTISLKEGSKTWGWGMGIRGGQQIWGCVVALYMAVTKVVQKLTWRLTVHTHPVSVVLGGGWPGSCLLILQEVSGGLWRLTCQAGCLR